MQNSQKTILEPDWPTLFDELKDKESLSSDAKLAESLGVSRGYICSVRKGRKNISLELAKKIFSRLGRTFETQNLERLLVPVKVRGYTYNMNAIKREVISRANGMCQLCDMKAPFYDKNGMPYLEMHYIVPIANGGSDTLENIVALCPNCHKKIVISPSDEDKHKLEFLTKENAAD